MARFAVVLFAALALAVPSAGAGSRASATTRCRAVTVRLGGNDFGYRIRIASGRLACDTARRVMRRFIANAVTPHGWFCTRGHGTDAWAASCARISPRALVRAYLIAG